jgi:predicted DNA-binding mobile mystery protein A
MKDAIRQLDQRFSAFRSLKDATRPSKGWVRAVRDALGMTTAQFAKRMGVSQPRVIAIEKAEISKAITLKTLERAAEAVGCRVVYLFVPDRSLEETVRSRARHVAEKQLETLGQTMRLEDQAVRSGKTRDAMRAKLIEDLVNEPARLWDEKW